MPPPSEPDGTPEYRVYRSRKPLIPRRGADDGDELARLRGEARPGGPRGPRKAITGGRIARWILGAVAAWIAVSVVLFLISAQIQQGKIGDDANALLGGAGYPLWSANNVLVL